MSRQIILYTGFAASTGLLTYPFAWFGDTIMMYNQKLGALGPITKQAAIIALNTLPASLLMYTLPTAPGFDLPAGKTELIMQSTMIPVASILLGLLAGDYFKKVISSFGEKSEKQIERIAQCVYSSVGTWIVYLGLFATKMAHLKLFV